MSASMKLHRTDAGVVVEMGGAFYALHDSWNALVNHEDLLGMLRAKCASGTPMSGMPGRLLAPVGSQEVWAAGVTYTRSREARVDESAKAGGASFYDRVYDAKRPELFFKAAPWRVRGPGDEVRIRRDASWNVPEPEIALCINSRGAIIGYTIGNDMSSRDIEGENPLYLPQAKTYDGSCALGPALLVMDEPLAPSTTIAISIARDGGTVFRGETSFSRMKRSPTELAEYLYRETSFPDGCVLLTGTGVVPPDDFTLHAGDTIEISVPPIGTLTNTVAAE